MKRIPWKLVILLLGSLVMMIIFGTKKDGYHVDEIYSYGLANSEYLPFMHFGEIEYGVKDWMAEYGAGESLVDLARNLARDFKILKECGFRFKDSIIYEDYLKAQANSADTKTTTWVSGQAYQDYLAVSESNQFNYASVYYNQRGDVHPPLYYMILHTVCSLFQGVFSKWFGLSINIVCLMLTLVVLYKMVREYLGGETAALLTVAVYGFSNGFVGTAMFLRMYALLTFMVVLCCYLHLAIAADDFRLKGKNRRRLMFVILGGFLTHYYFVLYAIGIAMVFILWMFVQKKWKEVICYLLTLAVTAVIGLCIWPYALRHVFDGYQGQAALNTILNGEIYSVCMKLMLDQVVGQLFGGKWWLFLVFPCIAVVIIVLRRRKFPWAKGCLISVPILLYTAVVAQIAPYIADRYIMCTYPMWCLFAVGTATLAVRGLADMKKEKFSLLRWKDLMLVCSGVFLLLCNNCWVNIPGYLNPGGQETVKLPENTDCVFVMPDDDWNQSAIDSPILAQCRRVGVVYNSELECLAEGYEYQTGDYVLVAIQKEMDLDAVLIQVKDTLGLQDLVEVERQLGNTAIRILLTGG